MKEITLNNKNYLLVEVPNDAYDFRYKIMPDEQKQLIGTIKDDNGNIGTCYIRENPQGKTIGIISDILKDEDICEGLVESSPSEICKKRIGTYGFKVYDHPHTTAFTATYSFQSWIQSIDLDMTKSYALIEIQ